MADPHGAHLLKVVLAGGGVAAVEAALALHELAGELVETTLVAPNPDLVYRPMSVREPFGYASAQHYPLADIAANLGIELVAETVDRVNTRASIVHTEEGTEVPFAALIVALGAATRAPYEHAITIDDAHLAQTLQQLLDDVAHGAVQRLVFVIPGRLAWPFPAYEIALMMQAHAAKAGASLTITIVSPEERPLVLFGRDASDVILRLLAEQNIEFISADSCEVPDPHRVVLMPDHRRIDADRVVSLPTLHGHALPGAPRNARGFIPVDPHCKVRGADRIYAAGDGTDFELKHGGIASQQADAAAEAIAALAGAPVKPAPFRPVVRGVMLTGRKPLYLSTSYSGGHGFSARITDRATWSPPTKISAKYLGPYLDRIDRSAGAASV
jgi:sulfide:quinone oxidoreductase